MIILTSIAILSTVIILDTDTEQIMGMVTVYVGFSIAGLLDIIIFYVSEQILPKNIDKLSIIVAFITEYVIASFDDDIDPVRKCLIVSILGCLISSVLMIVSGNSLAIFTLVMFTLIQGTWLIHSSVSICDEKMTNLYFSWHIFAAFTGILVISVMLHVYAETHFKTHMTKEHGMITASVDRISEAYSDTNTGQTVITHDNEGADECREDILEIKSDVVEKQVKEEQEIKNVLRTIDKMVYEAANNESSKKKSTNSDIDNIGNSTNERLSPLEEFNTLHKHVDGVRASIKLKESHIV